MVKWCPLWKSANLSQQHGFARESQQRSGECLTLKRLCLVQGERLCSRVVFPLFDGSRLDRLSQWIQCIHMLVSLAICYANWIHSRTGLRPTGLWDFFRRYSRPFAKQTTVKQVGINCPGSGGISPTLLISTLSLAL